MNDVFKKLKVKISISVSSVLAVVLAVLIGSLNLYLASSNKRMATEFIDRLIEDEGRRQVLNNDMNNRFGDFDPKRKSLDEKEIDKMNNSVPPEKPRLDNRVPPEFDLQQKNGIAKWIPFKADYVGFRNFFTAKLDGHGNIIEVVNPFSEDYGYKKTANIVKDIFKLRKKSGIYDYFEYTIVKRNYGYLVILLDRANEISQERNFSFVSILIYAVSILVAYLLSLAFSVWALKPVQEAFLKQKQFIADASHELKTPIAVIGANIDVLEQDMPDNKWLQYIKTENTRMGELVKNLLYLAKNDAGREQMAMLPFDLGDSTACAVLPFESVAFEQGKELEIDIPKNPIPVTGDEAKIKQVVIILTDNAIKNSESDAVIKISAGIENNKAFVKVYNSGHGIPQEEIGKIFNRFYRIDSSRNRSTGGYGLGLAIAQSIANAHGGQITVDSELEKYAEFKLTIPLGLKEKKHRRNSK